MVKVGCAPAACGVPTGSCQGMSVGARSTEAGHCRKTGEEGGQRCWGRLIDVSVREGEMRRTETRMDR